MTAAQGDHLQIVDDDIFVTNPAFVRRGIREKAANAVLIKLNQIGTVTETSACRGERIAKYNRLLKSRGLLVLPPYSNPHSNWHKRRETHS